MILSLSTLCIGGGWWVRRFNRKLLIGKGIFGPMRCCSSWNCTAQDRSRPRLVLCGPARKTSSIIPLPYWSAKLPFLVPVPTYESKLYSSANPHIWDWCPMLSSVFSEYQALSQKPLKPPDCSSSFSRQSPCYCKSLPIMDDPALKYFPWSH